MRRSTSPALRMQGICKSYGGVQVLKDINLDVVSGQALGLLGQNGAGKSTLIKILSGVEKPTSGEILIEEKLVRFRTAAQAQASGISTIHQEIFMVPDLSVAENLCLSHLPRRGRWFDRKSLYREAEQSIEALGFSINVRAKASSLTVAEKQVVLIAKALRQEARVLLLDEPTATLPAPDVVRLFDLLNSLKARGTGLIYISHRIDEIYEMCESVMILRDGQGISNISTLDFSRDAAIKTMLGQSQNTDQTNPAVKWNFAKQNSETKVTERVLPVPALEARNLCDDSLLRDISLRVMPGEAISVTGLVGSGQSELASCLFGDRRVAFGEIFVGNSKSIKMTPKVAIASGIGFVPEDRKTQGLVLEMDVGQNLTMANLNSIAPRGFLDRRIEKRTADSAISTLKIKTLGSRQCVERLSGGNQQKVVVGKWLAAGAKVLLMCEPTRGVDVGAREDIYREINTFLASGGSVIIFSSEIDEALMCHRIYVMAHGRVVGEFTNDETDPENIMALLR
jgi:ribose transport system ATP-binding protein